MRQKLVLDTSIFIEYQRTGSGVFADLLLGARQGVYELFVPTIVIAEFWAGRSMGDPTVSRKLELFFVVPKEVDLTGDIARKTGEIIRLNQARGFDAIVAATSLEVGASLVTNNTKHFRKVKGLKLFEPK